MGTLGTAAGDSVANRRKSEGYQLTHHDSGNRLLCFRPGRECPGPAESLKLSFVLGAVRGERSLLLKSALGKAIVAGPEAALGGRASSATRPGTAMRAARANALGLVGPSALGVPQVALPKGSSSGAAGGRLVVRGIGPQARAVDRNQEEQSAKPAEPKPPEKSAAEPSPSKKSPEEEPEKKSEPESVAPRREEPDQDLQELAAERSEKRQLAEAVRVRRKDWQEHWELEHG